MIITFASDYRSADGYAAVVKGVLKSLAPKAEIIDVAHDLHSIPKAALVLSRYAQVYPAGTIHLIIVDPTVGTSRRAVVGRAGGRYFVGPDNGIFTRVVADRPDMVWHEIDSSRLPRAPISATFHGRDIFAPAAATLANGREMADFGPPVDNLVKFDIPMPVLEEGKISGEVIDIDSFGNLIINISSDMLTGSPKVEMMRRELPFMPTFAEVPAGMPLAYIGSMGALEIAVNMGRAADYFGVEVGTKVTVTL
jgi:S-adenosylmethionine hydrolase